MSPCIGICTLDDDLVCMGCYRTLEEVRGWARMSGPEQWALLEELKQRANGQKARS